MNIFILRYKNKWELIKEVGKKVSNFKYWVVLYCFLNGFILNL